MNERFTYSGSATVGGVPLPNVRLQENPPDGGLRSWEGSASMPVADVPEGFPGDLQSTDALTIELSDGRQGQVLVSGVGFDGARWTIELTGTGPAPR